MVDPHDLAPSNLEPREPTDEDLARLCKALNDRGAKYVVIGGFAMRAADFIRLTTDIDLLIASDEQNEAKVFSALAELPDKAVLQLDAGDVRRFNVVRIADEVMVDLLHSAGGIDYADAVTQVAWKEINGVPIPFASPRLLWRFKKVTRREKDFADLMFLRHWFEQRGEKPPE